MQQRRVLLILGGETYRARNSRQHAEQQQRYWDVVSGQAVVHRIRGLGAKLSLQAFGQAVHRSWVEPTSTDHKRP